MPPKTQTNEARDLPNDGSSSDDDSYEEFYPFVIVDAMRPRFGCPPAFAAGSLKWDSKMTPGRSTDDTIRAKLTEFIRAHSAGESLEFRQRMMRDLWHMGYNQDACVFFVCFACADEAAKIDTRHLRKKDAITILIDANIPFVPFDVFQDFLHEATETYLGVDDDLLPPIDWEPDYRVFVKQFPFNGDNLKMASKKIGSSVRSEKSQAAAKATLTAWQLALSEAKNPGLSPEEKDSLQDDGRNRAKEAARTPAEAVLRNQLLDKHDAAMAGATKHTTFADKRKRPRDEEPADDEELGHPNSGLLAHEKFMKTMRATIERSEYINFASMSKDRLDQLHVLGIGSANSKRLSSSTVLLTSATDADVKIATYDFEAITSGFLYTYITLLSESCFTNAMARVKDRLAWWQWLTGFFTDNKPAAVKFIHWFMLAHHSEEFWLPITKTQCVLLAIKAKDECQLVLPSANSRSGLSQQTKTSKMDSRGKKVRPGPGTLTVNGGVTFSPSQTAKLVQWRSRFPGFCASRMTKEYTCSKEKRGLPCKFKHECAWCHSISCKATCAQAEKL